MHPQPLAILSQRIDLLERLESVRRLTIDNPLPDGRAEMGRNRATRLLKSGRIEITCDHGDDWSCRFVCQESQEALEAQRLEWEIAALSARRVQAEVHSTMGTLEEITNLPVAGRARGAMRLLTVLSGSGISPAGRNGPVKIVVKAGRLVCA